MKHFYFLCITFLLLFHANAVENDDQKFTQNTPLGLPQYHDIGMAFFDIDGDDDLEFIYSYMDVNQKITRIYQTLNGEIRSDKYLKIEDLYITDIQPVSFSPGKIQLLAVEPEDPHYSDDGLRIESEGYHFSLFKLEIEDDDNVKSLERIPSSFSSINFAKITYDVVDFDADGLLDIFFVGESKGKSPTVTEVMMNQGDFIFSTYPIYLSEEYKNATIGHYDFTKDGFQDVYVSGRTIDGQIKGSLFENVGGKGLEEIEISAGSEIPAVIDGEVVIQRINNNTLADMYVRGIGNDEKEISIICEINLTYDNQTDKAKIKLNTLSTEIPFFINGFTEIHDFNNDGNYDFLISGAEPLDDGKFQPITGIYYQKRHKEIVEFGAKQSLEDSLYHSVGAVADMNGDGRLEIVISGLSRRITPKGFDHVPSTFSYSNNFLANKAPSFETPETYLEVEVEDNKVELKWGKAKDDGANNNTSGTSGDLMFYEVHVWKNSPIVGDKIHPDSTSILATSSDEQGIRYFPSRGLVQSQFISFHNVSPGTYYVAVQAIDNGLMASEITPDHIQKVVITKSLPVVNFHTFELVQFREENFENKFEIVDFNLDGFKDFIIIDSAKHLSFFTRTEINVFNEIPIVTDKEVIHFELGDYTEDGRVDIWYLDENGDLFIYDYYSKSELFQIIPTEVIGINSFVLCDIDNDLDLDIIAESQTKNGTVFYENNGKSFSQNISFLYDKFLQPIGVYDFNGDSYLDFYYANDIVDDDGDTVKAIWTATNLYNDTTNNTLKLFNNKQIGANQGWKILDIVDGFDHKTDGDWDFLIETKDGFKVLRNNIGDNDPATDNWDIVDLEEKEFEDFNKDETQARLADFDGDFKKDIYTFNINELEIVLPHLKSEYSFDTDIRSRNDPTLNQKDDDDWTWGNTDGQTPLQWIKIVDLNGDERNDLLAHVIIDDVPKTYYFPNLFERELQTIPAPHTLSAEVGIGQTTFSWEWEKKGPIDVQAEYLLEMKQIISDGTSLDTNAFNFDAAYTIETIKETDEGKKYTITTVLTQLSEVNYLGSVDFLKVNELKEANYQWRVVSKISNRFSSWSDWNKVEIRNFKENTIPPVKDTSFRDVEAGTNLSEAADFNNDGSLDFLLISNKENKTTNSYLYLNNQANNFDTIAVELPAYGYADIKVINYDKDEFLDIIISGIDTDWKKPTTKIFRNIDGKSFEFAVEFPSVAFGSMDQGDIDNDGDFDYLITGKNAEGEYENYLIEDTSPSLATTPTFTKHNFKIRNSSNDDKKDDDNQNTPASVEPEEYKVYAEFVNSDRDEKLDIFFSVYHAKDNFFFIENNTDFYFPTEDEKFEDDIEVANNSILTTNTYEFPYTDWADYDGDGYLDLILLGNNPILDTIIKENNLSTESHFLREKAYFTDREEVTTDNSFWNLRIFNNQKGALLEQSNIISTDLDITRVEDITWWDYQNDGHLEFFIQQAGEIVFFEKDENTNSFDQSERLHIRKDDFTFSTFGFFTDDTRLDFVIGSLDGEYKLFINSFSHENYAPAPPTFADTSATNITIDNIYKFGILTDTYKDGTNITLYWNNDTYDTTKTVLQVTDSDAMRYLVNIYNDENPRFVGGDKTVKSFQYTTSNNFINLQGLEDGIYKYTVQSIDQGFAISAPSEEMQFEINMTPDITSRFKNRVCQNDKVGAASWFSISPKNQSYIWGTVENGDTTWSEPLAKDSVQFTFSSTGNQKIIVYNANFEEKAGELEVLVLPELVADFEIGEELSVGAKTVIKNTSNNPNADTVRYAWTFDDEIKEDDAIDSQGNVTHTFNEAGAHTISFSITNQIGCAANTDEQIVVNTNVVIKPSAFITQNGDGKNDHLHIEFLERYSQDVASNSITIFNEWGQEVGIIHNYKNDWDAVDFNSFPYEKFPIGNYFMIINVTVNGETQTFKSTFSVLK